MMKRLVLIAALLCALVLPLSAGADVTLPGRLTRIKDQAFIGNTGMTGTLTLPGGVTSIGQQAFQGCTGLTGLVIPQSVTRIGSRAFAGCTNLTGTVILPVDCNVAWDAFDGCDALTRRYPDETPAECFTYSIYGSASNGTVGITGFKTSFGVTNVIVPSRIEGLPVTSIATWAFKGCKSITSVVLPDGIKSIGEGAFWGCSSLRSVSLPEGLTWIGPRAFSECGKLADVTLPESLEAIAQRAFSYCSSLKHITIPEGIQRIDYMTFYRCSGLTGVTLPEGLTQICEDAFAYCSSLASITLPESLTGIGNGAFKSCESLTSIVFPEGLKSIGNSAFSECYSLMSITFPAGMNTIGMSAFSKCTGLTSIELPEGLKSIEEKAFESCVNVSSISFPEGLESIGDNAFLCCERVTDIMLPDSLRSVGTHAFYECKNVTSITLPKEIESIGEGAFGYCKKIKSIVLPDGLQSIQKRTFQDCYELENIEISPSVTSIGEEAFRWCGLRSIAIPPSVNSIGENAFEYCYEPMLIHGIPGSYAETYAGENGYAFQSVTAPAVLLSVSAGGVAGSGSLTATAGADGGTGSCTFSFELYQDGSLERQTPYAAANRYAFPIAQAGDYRVVVRVRDQMGMTAAAQSGTVHVADASAASLSGRVLDAMGSPVAGAAVTIALEPSGAVAATLTTDADGRWCWTQAQPGASYTITAAGDGLSFEPRSGVQVASAPGVVIAPMVAAGQGAAAGDAAASLSGRITDADGAPVQGVSVAVVRPDGTRAAQVTTDERGAWGVQGLTMGTAYTVIYGENQIRVTPASETVTPDGSAVTLSAVAEGIAGEPSDAVRFTMADSSIYVGYCTTFTLTVPQDVAKARLVVDGHPYDVLYPENGTCTWQRVFNSSGARRVAFQIARGGVWADISAEQTLNVIGIGQLDAPVYADIDTHCTGTALALDWSDVPNAQQYVVWLYCEGVAVDRLETAESAITLPADDFPVVGNYSVSVMATGRGYDQSAADDMFRVAARDYRFEMTAPQDGYTYVVGDQVDMQLTQSGGGYLSVQVVAPSGKTVWYPQSDTGLTGDASCYMPFTVDEAGTYAVTPYLYTTSTRRDGIGPHLIGRTVRFTVSGPSVRSMTVARADEPGKAVSWVDTTDAVQLTVRTNNAVENVTLSEGGAQLADAQGAYTEQSYVRSFALSLASPLTRGLHTVTAQAADQDSGASASERCTFYAVEEVSGGAVYPQAEQISLLDSPLNGRVVATARGGRTVDRLTVTGDAGDWYRVRTADGTEGFVPCAQVAGTAWEGATGGIVFTSPIDGISLPDSMAFYQVFSWETGMAVPEGALYTLTLDGLVTGTHIEETTTDTRLPIQSTRLPADEYTATVSLGTGSTLIVSPTIRFSLGNFSLEEAYRHWWKENIQPECDAYLKLGDPFSGQVLVWYGWGGFIGYQIHKNPRPQIIFEPATLAYTQMLEDFKDLKKDSTTNAQDNWALLAGDAQAMRREMLLSISRAMLEETEKGSLKLDLQSGSADSVAEANQSIGERESMANTIFAGAEATLNGVSVSLKAYAMTQGGALDDAVEPMLDALKFTTNVIKDTTLNVYREMAVAQLLSAYADQYARQMQLACGAYVTCLETTYLRGEDDGTGVYAARVQEYIDAFNALSVQKSSVGSSSRLYDEAVAQILAGSGYTAQDIEDMQNSIDSTFLRAYSKSLRQEIFCTAINKAAEKAYTKLFGETAKLPGDVVKVDENLDLQFDLSGIAEGSANLLLIKMGEVMIEETFEAYIEQNMRDCLAGKISLPKDYQEIARTFMKGEKKNWGNACSSVLGIVHDSWDLGVSLKDLATSDSLHSEELSGKGMFDTYGLQMIGSLKLRLDAQYVGDLSLYSTGGIDVDTCPVEDLEKLRQALVTLTNYDTSILTCYRNMRLINDANGSRFTYGIDWLTRPQIDERLGTVAVYRYIFMQRPAAFKALFGN